MKLYKKGTTGLTSNDLTAESEKRLFYGRHSIMKKLLAAVLLATLLISLTGCGNSDGNSDNSSASSESGNTDTSESGNTGEAEDSLSSSGDADSGSTGSDSSDSDSTALDYTDIVDEHLVIYLDYDSYGVQFDLALEAIADYLDDSASLDDTLAAIEAIQTTLTDAYNSLEDYVISDELSDVMLEYDVLPEEFEYYAELRSYQAAEYITDLDTVCSYLEHADEAEFEHEEVEFWYQIHSAIQDAYRGYYFYGSVNYWFAEWDESLAEYVQETVVPEIECYIPENWAWETSQTAAENKTMSYLDLVEDCVELSAEHLGNTNETISDLEAAMEELEEMVEEADWD